GRRESPEDIFWVQLAKFIEDAAAIEVQSKVTKSGQKNILELYRKEKEHQQIYVLQIAAYLSSIPEIQKGGHGVYERIKNNNNRFLGHPISEGVLGVLKRIKMPE
ncbi:MAG TPA: hypothetical protein VMR37_05285, partial [Rhabdochlamydiaceae bacterium]|nr:hypothetical protein [Rhabdochlamydiaceae bacterium]